MIGSKERAELERRLAEDANVELFLRKDRAVAEASGTIPSAIDEMSTGEPVWFEDIITRST